MSGIRQLSYIIIESNKSEAWKSYVTDFLGMTCSEDPDGTFLRVRMDNRSYRLLIKGVKGGEASEDIWAAGFQVAHVDALKAFEQDLQHKGVEVFPATASELTERDVEAMIWLRDPEGLRIEISCNPKEKCDDLVLPLVPGGYLTGELGFGHIAIGAMDLPACEVFYRDVLGFKLSDYIVQDIQGLPINFTFFHVNPRHHTLALAGVPMPHRLNHVMFEVETVDTVGLALERAKRQEINFYMNIGRHPNDRMLSFYVCTPSHFAIEYGTDGVLIDDEDRWEVQTYDAISSWGHKD